MTGITPICSLCGRPIIADVIVSGYNGEPYHYWCTRSPYEPAPQKAPEEKPYIGNITVKTVPNT